MNNDFEQATAQKKERRECRLLLKRWIESRIQHISKNKNIFWRRRYNDNHAGSHHLRNREGNFLRHKKD